MEWIGIVVVLIGAVVAAIFFTRGMFARDLTQALERVRQQESLLQEKADVLEQRLAQMERDYQLKLKRGDEEAKRVLQEAKNQAANVRTVAIEESKHRARQLMLEAEQGKQQLRSEILRELSSAATHRACDSLKALLTEDQMNQVHELLMKELIEALKRVDLRTQQTKAERIEVATALPLGSAESLRIKQWAAAAIGSEVPIQPSVDAALVAGGIVRVGQTVIDNSLMSRLNR